MRENPWHQRYPTTEHHQWFRNLVDLHQLTLEWAKKLQISLDFQDLSYKFDSPVKENLWLLENLNEAPLESLLDETSPGDLLGRLEHSVWAIQAWTVTASSRANQENWFEQIAWRLGKEVLETRWPRIAPNEDLKFLLAAVHDSPFSGFPHKPGFLLRRAVQTEVQLELRACPHQNPYVEVKSVADRLCRYHTYWMRGFVQAIQPNANIEHVVQSPRCFQRWYLGS